MINAYVFNKHTYPVKRPGKTSVWLVFFLLFLQAFPAGAQVKTIWKIGEADNSSAGMTLAPAGYKQFLSHDFGWEDRFYLAGYSSPEKDWPYVLPGPADSWGGTAPTAGIRSHQLNVLFDMEKIGSDSGWKLVIDLLGYNQQSPPLFKIIINNKPWVFQLPAGSDQAAITGASSSTAEHIITVPFQSLKTGGNEVRLTTLSGSWVVFDQVRLEGPANAVIKTSRNNFIREIKPADYEIIKDGQHFQPLLIDIEQLTGTGKLTVRLRGRRVFDEPVDSGRHQFEVPMPAVAKVTESEYEILSAGRVISSGVVKRSPQRTAAFSDYVSTAMGTAHSRWMIAPGPWMPFSMVKLSPDNQNGGWQAGYDPTFESIGTFSHIHEWTMAGLGMLPTNGPLKTKVGNERGTPGEGYRSRIDKTTEEAPLGYYKVLLTDYNIKAELTAATRSGFQRYTYPKGTDSRVMIDLQIPAEYG
ncbi:MAG: polysaccharide lyase family protein, partial [Ferruginibacter sp.]